MNNNQLGALLIDEGEDGYVIYQESDPDNNVGWASTMEIAELFASAPDLLAEVERLRKRLGEDAGE